MTYHNTVKPWKLLYFKEWNKCNVKIYNQNSRKVILRYFEKRAGDSTDFRIKALSFYTDLIIDDTKLSNALNNIDVTKTMVTQYTSVVDLYKNWYGYAKSCKIRNLFLLSMLVMVKKLYQ